MREKFEKYNNLDFLKENIIEVVKGYPVTKVSLFGSRARGNNMNDSYEAQRLYILKENKFRDIAAHKYETLKMGDVYDVVKQDYPNLKNEIGKILEIEVDERK